MFLAINGVDENTLVQDGMILLSQKVKKLFSQTQKNFNFLIYIVNKQK